MKLRSVAVLEVLAQSLFAHFATERDLTSENHQTTITLPKSSVKTVFIQTVFKRLSYRAVS